MTERSYTFSYKYSSPGIQCLGLTVFKLSPLAQVMFSPMSMIIKYVNSFLFGEKNAKGNKNNDIGKCLCIFFHVAKWDPATDFDKSMI